MKSIFPLTLAAAVSTLLITSSPLHAQKNGKITIQQATTQNSSRSVIRNNDSIDTNYNPNASERKWEPKKPTPPTPAKDARVQSELDNATGGTTPAKDARLKNTQKPVIGSTKGPTKEAQSTTVNSSRSNIRNNDTVDTNIIVNLPH